MPIRIYKPTSPGRRNSSVDTFTDITKSHPEKSLIKIKKSLAGRNNQGKITVRHRGGGVKRYLRIVDFKQTDFLDTDGVVRSIEYDPGRSSRIALVEYALDGKNVKRYIIAPDKLSVNDIIKTSQNVLEIKVGNRMRLEHIPVGTMIHNVELIPGCGGKLVRGAGVGCSVMGIEGKYAQVRLPSTEIRFIPKECLATIGMVSNSDHRNIRWGKAGRIRKLGFRPTVRGKAMNPIDHPHGGGEGNQPVGLVGPKTVYGKPALGVKTRKKYKMSNKFIVQHRKKKHR